MKGVTTKGEIVDLTDLQEMWVAALLAGEPFLVVFGSYGRGAGKSTALATAEKLLTECAPEINHHVDPHRRCILK